MSTLLKDFIGAYTKKPHRLCMRTRAGEMESENVRYKGRIKGSGRRKRARISAHDRDDVRRKAQTKWRAEGKRVVEQSSELTQGEGMRAYGNQKTLEKHHLTQRQMPALSFHSQSERTGRHSQAEREEDQRRRRSQKNRLRIKAPRHRLPAIQR